MQWSIATVGRFGGWTLTLLRDSVTDHFLGDREKGRREGLVDPEDLNVGHDRSYLHQSSEPTACGDDDTARAGDVKGGPEVRAFSGELEQQARNEYECPRETAPRRHPTGSRQA